MNRPAALRQNNGLKHLAPAMTNHANSNVQSSLGAALEGMFIVWRGLFNTAELDAIVGHGDGLAPQAAATLAGSDSYDTGSRITRVAWIERHAQSDGLFRRMEEVVWAINARFFRYDLTGVMAMQYTIYSQFEGSHFGWHQDYGVHPAIGGQTRKLTLSLQLSNDEDYEGCDLQLQMGDMLDSAPRGRGTLVAFPAWTPHRVTPIARGTRKCLVIWAVGPELR